jgi:hypothetical protein
MDAPSLHDSFRSAPHIHTPPELARVPLGKYHPANYRQNFTIPETLITSPMASLPSTPMSRPDREAREREREAREREREREKKKSARNSGSEDIRRKLHQYQREMVAQAAGAAGQVVGRSAMLNDGRRSKPVSPRLMPLGSPGPVTPMELEEMEREGYIRDMGARANSNGGLSHEEMVAAMVKMEEERDRLLREREGELDGEGR